MTTILIQPTDGLTLIARGIRGTVRRFTGTYGFINTSDKRAKEYCQGQSEEVFNPDIFLHYENIVAPGRRFAVTGETVRFDLYEGPRGPVAMNVVRNPDRRHKTLQEVADTNLMNSNKNLAE